MALRVLLLDGPNLNLLGVREPHLYGSGSLDDAIAVASLTATELGLDLEHRQSNHEGVLIDAIHAARGTHDGIVINPGGLAHTSVVLRDALAGVELPVGEVHVTNVHAREAFRQHSYISAIAAFVIVGAGAQGYELAVRRMSRVLGGR
ncbi:type II 3-dehydroquinate dehydratase [Protaetiibacter mangrovi]|uniref:3-dehydroquinate dehydratase n=1 Tax=Protaetiibacter mangrovi TaxID=2970926 RepID=A0ABT1ZI06_9MICO|nr:type II 3-dehydroquinate dehydratase [Protaetiibacter mangrovi]MCS0500322.1 type II 3-dehydroquinate dehydratase [Protaetiibacter mangrovi]